MQLGLGVCSPEIMDIYVKAPSFLLGCSLLHMYPKAPQEQGTLILFPELSCVHLCAICLFSFFFFFFFCFSHARGLTFAWL